MREIVNILLGVVIAALAFTILLILSSGLLHIKTPTLLINSSGTSNRNINIKSISITPILHLSFNRLNLNEFNNSNRNITLFIVYSRPGSQYGEISYFLVSTYSKLVGYSWILDRSGRFLRKIETTCPTSRCDMYCYTIKLLKKFNYLPHTGIPKYIFIIEGSANSILYNPDTYMLKPYNGDVWMYRICVYIPKIDLSKVLDIPLSMYRHINISKTYLYVDNDYRVIILRYFKKYVENCRTLKCLIYNILTFFKHHYKYTPYISISSNLVLNLLNRKYINCLGANTLLVLILRSFGIPARLAAGFIGSPYSTYQKITLQNAHAWTQIYVPGVGWVTIDSTPGIVDMYLRLINYTQKVSRHIKTRRYTISRLYIGERLNITGNIGVVYGTLPTHYLRLVIYDTYLRNGTWYMTSIVRNWGSMDINAKYIAQLPNILSRYVCYRVSLLKNIRYVPHVKYVSYVNHGEIIKQSDLIYSEGFKDFKICSIYISDIYLLDILGNIPIKIYKNINIPKNYLEVPSSDLELLKKIALEVTRGCLDIKCIINRLLYYINSRSKYGHTRLLNVKDFVKYIFENNIKNIDSLEANTLFILMLRSIGIPSRLVLGFYVKDISKSVHILNSSNIYAWSEIYIPAYGGLWIRIDATPGKFRKSYIIHYRRELSLIRGGSWNCTYIMFKSIFEPIRYIHVTVPEGLIYRYDIRSVGYGIYNISICYKASKYAKLGTYLSTVDIVTYNHNRVSVYIHVKSRTYIKIIKIFPKYVSPGSEFEIIGELLNDEGKLIKIPNLIVYAYILTSKNGNIVTTCVGKTNSSGIFRIICTIPENVKIGRSYYVELYFPGNETLAESRIDPYIYITRRCTLNIISNGFCFKNFPGLVVCLYNSSFVNVRIVSEVSNNIEINTIKSSNMISIMKGSNSIVISGILTNNSIFRLIYAGSVDCAYFDLTILLLRTNISVDVLNKISNNTIIVYRNSTLRLHINLNIPISLILKYYIYSYRNGTLIKTGYLTYVNGRSNIFNITLNNVKPGLYRLTIRILGQLIFRITSLSRYTSPLNKYRDVIVESYLLSYPNINLVSSYLFSKPVEVRSVLYIRILEKVVDYSHGIVTIVGKVLDKFSREPMPDVYVCSNSKCVLTNKSGIFSISLHLSPNIVIIARSRSPFYDSARLVIHISLIYMYLIYIVIGIIAIICLFSTYLVVKKVLKKYRRTSNIVKGRVGNVVGSIEFVSIGRGEPLIWSVNEPLDIVVNVLKDGEPVPDSEIKLEISGVYEGFGRRHTVVFRNEGIYKVCLYFNNLKICETSIKIVDYRLEIGRMFRDFVIKTLGYYSEYMTPRSIVNKLVERGFPKDIVENIVKIHEIVTYGNEPVDRRLFLEFVTLITSLDYG